MDRATTNVRIGRKSAILAGGCVLLAIAWRATTRSEERPHVAPRTSDARPERDASAPLRSTSTARGEIRESFDVDDVPTEFEPTARVAKGTVVDGLGGPIIGATVSARISPAQPPVAAVLSGPDGDFALSFSAESAEVCARAESYSSACIRARLPSDGNRLVLLPASSIVGRVVMEKSREAVSGATVTVTSRAVPHAALRTTASGADGAFSIGELPAGSYEIVALADRARSRQEHIAVGVGETSEPLLLVATPAVELTGEVSIDGSPCTSGLLRISGPVTTAVPVSTTGRVSVPGLWPGQYSSSVRCDGALPATEPFEIHDQPAWHAWKLMATSSHEAKNADAPGASIVAVLDIPDELGDSLQVFAEGPARFTEIGRRTGDQFVFDELPLGTYQVYANDRAEDARPATLTRAGQVVTVQLNIAAAATLSGVVLDEVGGPVEDAWVTQTRADTLAPSFSARVLTDGEGRFVFSAVKNVPYALSVSSPSGETSVDEIKAGADIVVRVARSASLSGSVLTSGRDPVPEFVVELTRDGDSEVREARGSESKFHLASLPPGAYKLTVRSPIGSATRQLTAPPGEAVTVELTLDAVQH